MMLIGVSKKILGKVTIFRSGLGFRFSSSNRNVSQPINGDFLREKEVLLKATSTRFSLRDSMRHARLSLSVLILSVNSSGSPVAFDTSIAAPSSESVRTVQSITDLFPLKTI